MEARMPIGGGIMRWIFDGKNLRREESAPWINNIAAL